MVGGGSALFAVLVLLPSFAAATEGGTHGVEGISSTKLLSHASVSFALYTFSGEKDSSCGNNAWSLQLNTNSWIGSNGDTYVDQFTYQNEPNWVTCGFWFGLAQVCVWQVDVTKSSYAHSCNTGVPMQTLAKGYVAYVFATDSGGILNATFEVGTKMYSATASDSNGLATHWYRASGNILGFANGSTAKFTSPTDEYAVVSESSSGTATKFLANTGATTSEMNNLNLKGAILTGCSFGTCNMQAHSTN